MRRAPKRSYSSAGLRRGDRYRDVGKEVGPEAPPGGGR